MPETLEMMIAKQEPTRHERALATLVAAQKGIALSILKARARVEATREIIAEIARRRAMGEVG